MAKIINIRERNFIEWYLLNVVDERGEPTPEELQTIKDNEITYICLRAIEQNIDDMPEVFKSAKKALKNGNKEVIGFIADMIIKLKNEYEKMQKNK